MKALIFLVITIIFSGCAVSSLPADIVGEPMVVDFMRGSL